MSGFSPDWLALREPVDHAARNPQVLAAVGAAFASRKSVTVIDLGCGGGSNLRGSYSVLPQRQHWTLVDADPRLLTAARERLAAWAESSHEQGEELILSKDGKSISVDFRQVDLNTDIEWVQGWQPDLVTAAALFDLASSRWLERFVASLVSQRLPLYAALTYDGRESWQPAHKADARVLSAFLHHQRTDKGFGPAAGPDATEIMAQSFRKSGCAVSIGDSPWVLDGREHGALIRQLAAGIAEAAAATGHVEAAVLDDWLAARNASEGGRIGHHDLWARPV